MSSPGHRLPPRVRFARILALAAFAILAGVVSDWFAGEGRLLFPRPMPEFRRVPPR
jgi:hypothetical protein